MFIAGYDSKMALDVTLSHSRERNNREVYGKRVYGPGEEQR